ncbi:MAG: C-GCAxxG-C-C family protein [Verrucomicrobiota bacterium]|jgi:C_GCAxxG_C_C family probable redox protein
MNHNPDQTAQRSGELFEQGLCCSESVLQAIAESYDIRSDLIPRIATGLCAGISRTGGICGAVSGGVLAISMVTGRSSASASREENHRLTRTFLSEFEAKFSSNNCEKLIGCRLDTPEGQQFFKENNLRKKCIGFTREAARMASALLEQHISSQPPK